MKRWILSVLAGALLLAAQLLAGCSSVPDSDAAHTAAGTITVKVLNIGQGDSILIQTAEKTVLVDTSDVDERDKLRTELKKADVKKIDTIILTHPHADHIGGMDILLDEYPVGMVYDNGMPSTSKLFLGYVKKLKEKKIERKGLVAGDRIDLGGLTLEVIETPGHTAGSVCYYDASSAALFSGDTVFRSGCGRTDLPTGSDADMRRSLEKLRNVNIRTVYPGHGPVGGDGPASVLGASGTLGGSE